MSLVSLVFPIYNEEENIPELFSEILKVKEQISEKIEVLFVNDGSRDNSNQLLSNIASKHSFVKIVDFSRNFGHQVAITAGINFAEGDAVITMDSDLQDPPQVIIDLIKKWQEGYEIVYAKRRTRKDTMFKRLTAFLYYRLLKFLTDIKIPEDTGDFRLLDRKVVTELKKFKEKSRYIRGMVSFVGFRQGFVLFDRNERFAGKTKYPLRKMLRFAIDGITGFSVAPLKLAMYFGFTTAFLSILGIIYVLFFKFFYPEILVPGWSMTIISIFFIGGVQMIMIGIIGEYIGRVYIEAQDRPLYIVKEKINFLSDNSDNKNGL